MSLDFIGIDEDVLASCVSCGLCLPHCPTYRATGLDSHSPRGRIALVQAVHDGGLVPDDAVIEALDSCVQCMGCLPACPSSVRYDKIIHPVVETIMAASSRRRLRMSLLLSPLGRPVLLGALTRVAAMAQRLSLMPKRVSAPRLSLRRRRIASVAQIRGAATVDLLTGCVMGEWYADVHDATIRVLTTMGYNVRPTSRELCCGALHAHAGLTVRAESLLQRVRMRRDQSQTLVVNSAGCGAHLAGSGVGVVDVMEFIAQHLDLLPTVQGDTQQEPVVVHDACHSKNILGSHTATHEVLRRWYDLRFIPDEGLCCGAGGAYSVMRPAEAGAIVDRKFAAISSMDLTGVELMSSGNPGCTGHLASRLPDHLSTLRILHPIQLVDRMIGGA